MLDASIAALFGLAQGLRHALEPDHVAALATLVVGRVSTRASIGYAAAWGLGHGLVLVVLGGACAILGAMLPRSLADGLELLVAAMLIALGVRAWRRPKHAHAHASTSRRWPLLIGCVHGVAGTGAIVTLAAAGGHASRGASLAGIGVYAIGAAIGMMLLAGACGPAIARLARSPRATRFVTNGAGAFSIALGLFWAVRAVLLLAA